jgi:hypothetical protein
LPQGATVFGDKGYGSEPAADARLSATGGRCVAGRRRTLPPNPWADADALRLYRKPSETVYRQVAAMGLQPLQARPHHAVDLKAGASLLALAFTHLIHVLQSR